MIRRDPAVFGAQGSSSQLCKDRVPFEATIACSFCFQARRIQTDTNPSRQGALRRAMCPILSALCFSTASLKRPQFYLFTETTSLFKSQNLNILQWSTKKSFQNRREDVVYHPDEETGVLKNGRYLAGDVAQFDEEVGRGVVVSSLGLDGLDDNAGYGLSLQPPLHNQILHLNHRSQGGQ